MSDSLADGARPPATREPPGTVSLRHLVYPILCLTRRAGVCVLQNPAELDRFHGAAFWRAAFFEDLSVVDGSGNTFRIERATIRRPASPFGQRIARFLELPLAVDADAEAAEPVSLADVKRAIDHEIDVDPETFEEFSNHDVAWWKRSIAESETIADLMRLLVVERR